MPESIVLVTGATGHIGFRVVVVALQYGYQVRAVVRTKEQIQRIKAAQAIQEYQSNLQFAVVPNILSPDALDNVMEGITHLIHAARVNIQPTSDFERSVLDPATQSVDNILSAAYRTLTVERVVFTSSIIAKIPWENFVAQESDIIHDDKSPVQSLLMPSTHKLRAYAAFKSTEVLTVQRFCTEHVQASFDVMTIYPGYAIGGHELDTHHTQVLSGSNRPALGHLLGLETLSHFGPFPSCSAHLNDVAEVHVRSLSPHIPGNQSFIVSSGGLPGVTWEDGEDIVRQRFTQDVRNGTIPLGGSVRTHRVLIDAQRTEAMLNMKFKNYEEQVTDLLIHYISLKRRSTVP